MNIARRSLFAAALLVAGAGGALAQESDASFYADPVFPDPVLGHAPVYPAALATAAVATVSPASQTPVTDPVKRPDSTTHLSRHSPSGPSRTAGPKAG